METTRLVSPSLAKIQQGSYADRPSSSTTLYSADVCSGDALKHVKPRERKASIASSVNSSKTSDPLSEDDIESPGDAEEGEEEPEEFVGDKCSPETTVQSFKMQTHLRGMQGRLEVLQRLMQEAAIQSILHLRLEETETQAKPCLISVETARRSDDNDQLADIQASAPKERVGEILGLTSTPHSVCAERRENDEVNDSRNDRNESDLTFSSEEGPSEITTLLRRIKAMQAQLKEATDENQQLQYTVHKLEQENARLHAKTASHSPAHGEDNSSNCISESNAMIVMEEDMGILKDHERCQHKLHELWDTVRQLKMLVATCGIERNAMKIQRDNAIAEAERADVENIKLASSNNVQQRIKYLQQMKKDNQTLRRKNRALNVRIVKETVKLVRENNGYEGGDITMETVDSALLDETLHEFNDHSVRAGEEILRSIRNCSRRLEQRLERLHLARQDVLQWSETSKLDGQMSVVAHKKSRIGTLHLDPMGTPHANAEQHLDGFASAPGLMQLSSLALVASADGENYCSSNTTHDAANYNDDNSRDFATSDASLPSGWQLIIHGSGLPCYVHEGLGVVCWTRPYPLGEGDCGTLSQSELHRLVKQHVPPLSTFAPATDVATQRQQLNSTAHFTPSSKVVPKKRSSVLSKKRKLDVVAKEQKGSGQQHTMTLEEFKTLSIGDPGVLQASMELSIKTPAQVLQEYQNRNRGVSINYNTVPVEGGGVKLFKTIVTAGSTVAEGVASTKKIAKQLAAQQVLAILHEHTAQRYHEVAEMYNNSLKGQPLITESSTYGPSVPLRNDARGGRSNEDLRHQRSRSASNRMRRARHSPPNQEYDVSGGYRDYELDRRRNVPPHWSPYNQQPMQLAPQQAGPWDYGGQQGDAGMDNAGPERVVVYSTTPAESAGGYGAQQYYNNAHMRGNAWGHYPNANQPNLPEVYPQQYSSGYEIAQPPPENRPYGNYHVSDRPNTSIERVTANRHNQMSNQRTTE